MQNTTKRERRPSRLAPVLAAVGTAVVMLDILICVLLDSPIEDAGAQLGMLVLLAAATLAVIAGVAAAMVQRLREIGKGEEIDARKY